MDFKKVIIAFICIFALPLFVSAQGTSTNTSPRVPLLTQELFNKPSSTAPSSAPAAVVANINLSNITILSQESGEIRIAFDIVNNGDTPQSDVRYGAELIKKTSTGQGRADTFVPDETLALSAKQTLHRELTYSAPPALSGAYELWVKSKTTSGLTLGVGLAGNITLPSSQGYVEIIDGPSCFLQVSGNATHYNRGQGVDIKSDEELSFTCTVRNTFTHGISVSPSFEVYERSLYGRLTNAVIPPQSLITLAAGESKLVSFVIPKADKPQAYDVNVFLVEQNTSTPISNKVTVHYVLQGASATIQDVSIDKTSYAKGETILARLFWTASADQFPGSRAGTGTKISDVSVKATVVDSAGVSCADPVTQTVSQTEKVSTIHIVTTKECVSPKVSVTLLGENGAVYDSRTFLSPEGPKKNTPSLQVISVLIGGILILLLAAFLIRRAVVTKNANRPPDVIKPLLLLVIISSGFFMSAGVAGAMTLDSLNEVVYTVNTNKTVYSPGETITLSGSGDYAGCGNGSPTFIEYASLQGDIQTLTSNHFNEWDSGSWNFSTPLFTAPTTAGDYTISVSSCTGITRASEHDSFAGSTHTYDFGGSIVYGVWSVITSSLQSGGTTLYSRTIPYQFVGFPSGYTDGTFTDSCAVGSLPITVVAPCAVNQGASCASSANACGQTTSGTIQCDGICSVSSAPANPSGYGNACTSSANACGSTNAGTIDCNGACSASTPANPSGYGSACTSSANACGTTNSGTFNCSGSCSASTPANPSGYGNACTSSANACGSTNSGTIQCNGSCSVSAPANPSGYGSTCTSSANSCGQTNSGTVGCNGCSASAPSDASCSCSVPFTQNVQVSCDANQQGASAISGSVTRSQVKSDYPSCSFPTPVTSSNSTYVSDTCTYPTGTWTAPSCPSACGTAASNPPYSCVGGNGVCATNSPATLSCPATASCSCPAPYTQTVQVACDAQAGNTVSGSVTRSQAKSDYPSCSFPASPVTNNNSTYVSDTCVYTPIPTGTWTAPSCPSACGTAASNPSYSCVGGNGICSTNSPATLSCSATAACTCSAPLTQNVSVACDANAQGASALSGSVTRSQTKSDYPSCTFPSPVTSSNSTYVSDTCTYPTGTWTAPVCPSACGSAASNPAYSCVGGNGICATNSPATLSCSATAACTCSAPLTQNVSVACDPDQYGVAATSGSVTRSQTKSDYPSCSFPPAPITSSNSTYVSDNCVYPAAVCSNGANNYPTCSQCPSGQGYINGSCTGCSGGCTGSPGGSSGNPTGGLSCNNGAINPVGCSTFRPTATLSASLTTIDQGQSSMLTWNSSPLGAATGCVGTGFTAGGPSGSRSTGTLSSPGTNTYQVICSGAGGDSLPAFASVEVLAPDAHISANPLRVQVGAPATISWSATGVTSCSVTGPGSTTLASGPANSSHVFSSGSPVSPIINSQTTYTITCTTNGAPVSRSVTVNVQPLFQEF